MAQDRICDDARASGYEAEARERWGATDAYRESARRSADYGAQDWARCREESARIEGAIATLMDAGVAPEDPRATAAVERHRLHIQAWFYPCSLEMHARLGEMYVADARFLATYEKIHPGMAHYIRAASAANASGSPTG